MDYYNGYTPQERNRKLRQSYKDFPNRTHPLYHAESCQMCGEQGCKVEPHTEDYSEPYLWVNPAEYAVCKTCHSRIHKRFKNPTAWEAYKRHLKRGGHGSDLKIARIGLEVRQLSKALAAGTESSLTDLRSFRPPDPWWDELKIDPASLTAESSRPRK